MERFWAKVRKSDGCWRYEGGSRNHGYVTTSWFGTRVYVHRKAYELAIGPIQRGLVVDHVLTKGCRFRDCCRPDHLEAVTQRENVQRAPVGKKRANGEAQRRKTSCPVGHPYDEANTYRTPRGGRQCRQCRRDAQRGYNRRRRLTDPFYR